MNGTDWLRVSVDASDGSVWVCQLRKLVERYSKEAQSLGAIAAEALSVQADPAGGRVWIVTPSETRKLTADGELIKRANHAGMTTQAWITVLN